MIDLLNPSAGGEWWQTSPELIAAILKELLPTWIFRLTQEEFETYLSFDSEEGFNPQTKILPASRWDDSEYADDVLEEKDKEDEYYDECTCGPGVDYSWETDPNCPIHGDRLYGY